MRTTDVQTFPISNRYVGVEIADESKQYRILLVFDHHSTLFEKI